MSPRNLKGPRCKAKSKTTKRQCGRAAIPGAVVCGYHGGKAPQVKAKAQERLADLIDPDRALRTAAALAYSDISDIYDDNYKLKPLKEWPPALRQALRRIEPKLANIDKGDGALDTVLRVELHDKIKPLEMLFKHMGLLTERVEHSGGIEIKWQD